MDNEEMVPIIEALKAKGLTLHDIAKVIELKHGTLRNALTLKRRINRYSGYLLRQFADSMKVK